MNRLKFYLSFLFFGLLIHSQSRAQDDVEVVISSGLDWSIGMAISPNRQFVAKTFLSSLSIWDIKTGRMLRNVAYTDDLVQQCDSIWFSDDSKTVITNQAFSNDQFHVDVATGKSVFVAGPPMDYTNYKYSPSNRIISTTHLYEANLKDLVFKSPDGKTKLIYKKEKNTLGATAVMPYCYLIYIEKEGTKIGPIDSVYSAAFAFSSDSKYLFVEKSIFDLELKRRISDLKVVPFSGRSITFYPDTHMPITCSTDGVRFWDFPNVNDIHAENFVNFKSSNDSKTLVCEKFSFEMDEKQFFFLDLKTKKRIGKMVTTKESSLLIDISGEGDKFSFLEMSKKNDQSVINKLHVCDRETGSKIRIFTGSTKAFFCANSSFVVIDTPEGGAEKVNLSTGAKTDFPSTGKDPALYLNGVSQDHKYLFGTKGTYEGDKFKNTLFVFDSETGETVFEKSVEGTFISGAQLSPDHKLCAFVSSKDNTLLVYDFQTGEEKFAFTGHLSLVEECRFSDDSKRLISSSMDGTRRIWNLEKGTAMVSLITTGPDDFAIVTPSQYYYATKGAKSLIHFVKGTEVFPFGQFDLKYNRPDIILQSLEASNQELIEPFNLAYKKRLKRMGFTEEMLDGDFQLPLAEVANYTEIPLFTSERKLTLDIAASDLSSNLDRLIIRVNGVPVNGKDGLSLKEKSAKSIDQSVDVDLSSGKNVILVSVMNAKGVESLAQTVVIDYEPDVSTQPNLHLFSIGASKYVQTNYDLSYAAKDALDLSALFGSNPPAFKTITVHQLTDSEVSADNIQKWSADLNGTAVDDIVCVFYAGHGILDAEFNYYLASHQIDFTNPSEKGIPYELFESLLDDIPARRKLLMIDACHSGEIDKEELVVSNENADDSNDENITFRAINTGTTKNLGLSSSFELMKELFTDLRKSSGTLIISSAGGLEFAIEGDAWNNGVFTYSFLTGIKEGKADLNKDGVVMVGEMNTYLADEVFRLTNGRQQPTNRTESLESDWRLW